MAAKFVRTEKMILFAQIGLLIVGVASLFLSHPEGGAERTRIQREIGFNAFLARLVMTFISMMLTRLCWRNWQERTLSKNLEDDNDEG